MKFKNKQSGFTLIETLVALLIFSFSITGLISVTATGVNNTNFVKNKLTASYLALEGIELVRNIRDSEAIEGISLSDTLDNTLGDCYDVDGLSFCMIKTYENPPEVTSCNMNNGGCNALEYNDNNATFGHSPNGSDPSIFTRSISIEQITTNEVKVTSTVEWAQGANDHSTSYSINLTDWINPA